MKNIILILFAIALLSSCDTPTQKKTVTDSNLASQIEYADKMNNKVVFEGASYKMIVFAMKSDQILKPHTAPTNAPLYMLEGSAIITIGEEEQTVVSGDMITLPKDIDHGVYPITDCKFMLLK